MNLVRCTSSGTLYARLRVRGKLIWQSLETPDLEAEKKGVDDLASKGELQQTTPATSG